MSRNSKELNPKLQDVMVVFLKKCYDAGLKVKITECYRSYAEQQSIYNQGRTTPGSIISNCQPGYSPHNWGVAFDICRNDGKGAYAEDGDWWNKVGKIGLNCGLQWGGSWTDWCDRPHFQLREFFNDNYQSITDSKIWYKYGSYDSFKSKDASWKIKSKTNLQWGDLSAEQTEKQLKDTYKISVIKNGLYAYNSYLGSSGKAKALKVGNYAIKEVVVNKYGHYWGQMEDKSWVYLQDSKCANAIPYIATMNVKNVSPAPTKNIKISVTKDGVYAYKGPGSKYGKTIKVAIGSYEVVETKKFSNGHTWGKLLSKAGWVYLNDKRITYRK